MSRAPASSLVGPECDSLTEPAAQRYSTRRRPVDWLRQKRTVGADDGVDIEYTCEECILAAKGDRTAEGDMLVEALATDSRLPID